MNSESVFSKIIDELFPEAVSELQSLVRIPSVNEYNGKGFPFGKGIHDSLVYCSQLGDKLGFFTCDMDDMCSYIEYGNGEEMVAAVAHLDVVPVGDGWTKEPFGGIIENGRMYGRGTLDDKGPAIAVLYAIKAIEKSGLPISRRIRLILGTNEEISCKGLIYYREHGGEIPKYGFSPDALFPAINSEKGNVEFTYFRSVKTGETFNILEIASSPTAGVVPSYAMIRFTANEKAIETAKSLSIKDVAFTVADKQIIVEAWGKIAHAGVPQEGENAISRLFLAINELPLEGDFKALSSFIASTFSMDVYGTNLGIAMSDEPSGPVTVTLGQIEYKDSQIILHFNVRTPSTIEAEVLLDTVKNTLGMGGFTEVSREIQRGLYMNPDCFLVKTLNSVYHELTGFDTPPLSISGGTYARFLPNIVAFGPNFPGEPPIIHQSDEYMDLNKMKKVILIYACALYELAK